MLSALHYTIMALYFALPVGAFGVALIARGRGDRQALGSFVLTVAAGVILAIGVGLVYAYAVGGRPFPMQILISAYFAVGLLLLLKCFDGVLSFVARRAFGLRKPQPHGFDPSRSPHVSEPAAPQKALALRYIGMQLVRLVILFAVGLPYVMATVMTYRPKVATSDDPMSQLGFKYERVEFDAIDGTKLVGWWIPAPSRVASDDDGDADSRWGRETVLVCHGLAANKSNQLVMARDFPLAGYNVLIFDFRAHGESGGQLTTFGDLERRDVLGAVRYLRSTHQNESQRILGVGASMGAAALLAAATDPSEEGQAIDAIALYGTYNDLGSLSESIADLYFAPPMDWLLTHLAVPMASVQTGRDIRDFAPATLIRNLWPRPVFIIHGVDDEIIPFEHGQALFDAASLPKSRFFLPRMSHNSIITDENAGQQVLEFFKSAEDVPVI